MANPEWGSWVLYTPPHMKNIQTEICTQLLEFGAQGFQQEAHGP